MKSKKRGQIMRAVHSAVIGAIQASARLVQKGVCTAVTLESDMILQSMACAKTATNVRGGKTSHEQYSCGSEGSASEICGSDGSLLQRAPLEVDSYCETRTTGIIRL